MSNDFNQPNPYQTPSPYGNWGQNPNDPTSLIMAVKGKVIAPAIALMVVGVLGLGMSIFNVVLALFVEAPLVDPNAPEFVQQFQAGGHGALAAALQALFIVVNSVIIAGAVQMLRFKMRTFGIASSVLAMVNIGTCCCIIGLPVGIWSLIVLLSQNVVIAFKANE